MKKNQSLSEWFLDIANNYKQWSGFCNWRLNIEPYEYEDAAQYFETALFNHEPGLAFVIIKSMKDTIPFVENAIERFMLQILSESTGGVQAEDSTEEEKLKKLHELLFALIEEEKNKL